MIKAPHFLLCLAAFVTAAAPAQPFLAMGARVGEVTENSALIWVRLTETATRRAVDAEVQWTTLGEDRPLPPEPNDLKGACPGAPGKVRVRFATNPELKNARTTDLMAVSARTDFTHKFPIENLKPATRHYYRVEAMTDEGIVTDSVTGQFITAPPLDAPTQARFCVVTGQAYRDLDSPEGFLIYRSMLATSPEFVVFTGDNVYYDNDPPVAKSVDMARYHWQRMYSLPRHKALFAKTSTYWEVDDHDIVRNDCWPGVRNGKLTFAEGLHIYQEQVPIGDDLYRTFRWGRNLQIWLVEGRAFRSPNKEHDGPNKSIWGEKQKAWLKQTLKQSNATWKILVSPTPMVGPDRSKKQDNHANAAFQHEGDEMRNWFHDHLGGRFFVICGDRHWQYHSVDSRTRVQEFSCGPASDQHAGGSPGFDEQFHRFHRVKGGFLGVEVKAEGDASEIQFNFHSVDGKVVYSWSATSE